IGVDISGFTDAMQRQKAESRSHWAGSGEKSTETVWFELKEKHGATEFLGYDTETADGVVQAIVKDGAVAAEAAAAGFAVERRLADDDLQLVAGRR
ncbi:hypothetical protein, partial [Rhizobium leguminosarum]|uniref:hypothetical protein n=1 Tax=Rhizobium leguminosarum TaxID=384 RepID=UPI003F96D2AF